jgi:hypothetical protein
MLPVLRELARFVEDLGVVRASPLICFADNPATLDHERDVLETRFVARVGAWFACLA